MVMGLPEKKCFRLIKNVGVNRAPVRIHFQVESGIRVATLLKTKNLIRQNKCFEKIIENVGVNRAPAWIRQPGQVGDSGRDTFENKILIKRNKCFD